MIFSRLDRGHESHKERNFYTKVFAGCLFNELLSSYEHTSTGFLDLLHTRYGQLSEEIPGAVVSDVASEILRKLAYSKPPMSLTFDYHAYQLDKNADNGELGDIVIFTPDSSVCIEAKLYDDWCFHEDFAANRRRIETVSELTSLHGIQVMLLSKRKWENCKAQQNHSGSHYKRLQTALQELTGSVPFMLLFWEDLYGLVRTEPNLAAAASYMDSMLKSNGWKR